MQQRVQQYILQNNLPQSPARLIVGVSGGADSVALLHLLLALGYDCIVAHCNFQLRAAESIRDANFVRALAQQHNLAHHSICFDTKAYAREKSISIEMAARDLRYAWFEQLRIEQNAQAVAVAHHANDVVETFLMNMVRGTGIRGLTGIKPVQAKVVRPFLEISRQEIEQYLQQNNLDFVTDSSNLESDYTRNKYRNTIIPLLEQLNPSLQATILDEIKVLNDVFSVYSTKLAELQATLMQPTENGFSLDIEALNRQQALSTLLYEFFSPYGFSADMIPQVLALIAAPTGKKMCSNTHCLLKDRTHLLLYKIEKQCFSQEYFINESTVCLDFPLKLSIEQLHAAALNINKEKTHAYLDFDKLQFPLKLRKWQAGDSFVPFGMKGRKKLSDLLVDAKMSSLDKQSVWVLESANQIAWVVGLRVSAHFGVSAVSAKVLHISLL